LFLLTTHSPLAILIGPGQQTLEQCREFLQTVEENIASLSGHGSNLDSMANHSQSREDLEERLEKARTSMGQCDAYVAPPFLPSLKR
jgi:hypothetical protein